MNKTATILLLLTVTGAVHGSTCSDATFCGDENRRRIVEEIKSALPHPVMINTPTLTCN